jgi:UDP-3-O-acyl-N-acetylglucosamine deacetylase
MINGLPIYKQTPGRLNVSGEGVHYGSRESFALTPEKDNGVVLRKAGISEQEMRRPYA